MYKNISHIMNLKVSTTEAHVLPYQDEQLMSKWLMMYLETHPKYQGQDVGQEVFTQWKKLLIETCDVSGNACALSIFILKI